jgi:tripartite-type tricarboxylate transporter receptor subunit TctC
LLVFWQLFPFFSFGQNFPERTIRLIVPFTPGGGTDTVSRQLIDKMTQEYKWSVVIDNKPGAGGNIGLDLVAKAKPDGYSIAMGQTSNLAINPALLNKMPFDAGKDFVPIALVAEVPMILVVRGDSPWRSLDDLLKAAELAKSNRLKMASAGTGTVGHLAGEMLAKRTGLQFLHIPYKGAVPAITDLLGGQTDWMFATPQAVIGMLTAGKLRALAVSSSKRIGVLGKVPTIAELGLKGFEATDWKVLVGPAGMPIEAVRLINEAASKALLKPDLIQKFAEDGSTVMSGNPEQVSKYIKAQQMEWATLIREAGIQLD